MISFVWNRFQRTAGAGVSGSRRATIGDVAVASGVGIGTVSRVINGAKNVRETTRAKVLKVIDELGYRPSHLAASLSRGTQRTVAIVVPQLTRASAVMRLAGALAVLDQQGYDTVVCNVDTLEQRDHHLSALTSKHRADGVIVVSLRLSPQQLASFRRAGVPIVTVDALAPGVPQTITDDVAGRPGGNPAPAVARAPQDRLCRRHHAGCRCRVPGRARLRHVTAPAERVPPGPGGGPGLP